MNKRPYNPFENFDDLKTLKVLIIHILKSVKVTDIVVEMPGVFDTKLIYSPDAILPVNYINVGNATFEYIRYKAKYILSTVKDRIGEINRDDELGFDDKLEIFREVKETLWQDYQYFNLMNPIRYMSDYQWKIGYFEEVKKKTVHKEKNYPNSKIALTEGHWNYIDNNFSIRRHLLYEIMYVIDLELQKLDKELSDTKYKWKGEKWEYEIYEIILAILASDRVDMAEATEKTFIHDFLSFFGKSDMRYSYFKGKILDRSKPRGKYNTRGNRSIFLDELKEKLEKSGLKTTKKRNK